MNLKFRKRDVTDYIYIVKKDLHNIGITPLRNKCLRRGGLDTGFHFIVRPNGEVIADRVEYAYAGWWFNFPERSLAILVDTNGDEMSSAIKKAIKEITNKYPQAQILETNDAGDMED